MEQHIPQGGLCSVTTKYIGVLQQHNYLCKKNEWPAPILGRLECHLYRNVTFEPAACPGANGVLGTAFPAGQGETLPLCPALETHSDFS